MHDEWVWRGNHGGHYSVKDAYNKITFTKQGEDSHVFLKLWKTKDIPT